MSKGIFVTFEGGEGSGKTTQITLLESRIKNKFPEKEVLVLREPGGTPLGEEIRAILLDVAHTGMADNAELMLYEAARVQLVCERIKPALEAGIIVVCDRFYDSTTAYQGFARGLNLEDVKLLNWIASLGLVPDATYLMDGEAKILLQRAAKRGPADRLEQEDVDFHERVRQGFLSIAMEEPERFAVLDATKTIEVLAAEIWEDFLKLLDGSEENGR